MDAEKKDKKKHPSPGIPQEKPGRKTEEDEKSEEGEKKRKRPSPGIPQERPSKQDEED